jgi:hypothetical protein
MDIPRSNPQRFAKAFRGLAPSVAVTFREADELDGVLAAGG